MPPSPRISVRLADDRRTAFVTVRAGAVVPGGTGRATEQDLRDKLTAAQVTTGIDDDAFRRVALGLGDAAFEISDETIARGALPQEGMDGGFEPVFQDGIQPGHLRPDGSIDFFDRELLKGVQKDEVLGQMRRARPGTEGFLVDGTVTAAASVKELVFALGSGVVCDPKGLVRATRAGVVAYRAFEAIDVVETHVHQGPVDLRSGHLHMQGSLQVMGDVVSSLSVYASGDIEICGSVDSGTVRAGGDVRVHGVRGERAMVCAGGNLSVHHAEAATLYAGKLLQIGETVHAQISAGRVESSGKLRGGLTRAELSIIASEVGSPNGKETEVAVAEPLEPPVEYAQRALDRAKALRVAQPAKGASSGGPAKGGKLGRVVANLQSAEIVRLAARAKRGEMLGRIASLQVAVAYPGVTVRIADQKMVLEREARNARFSIDGDTGKLRVDKVGS